MESSSSSSSSDAPIAARRGLRIALIGVTHADIAAAWNALRHRQGYTFTHVSLDARIERLMSDLFGLHTHEIRSTHTSHLLVRETIAVLCGDLSRRLSPKCKAPRPFAHALKAVDPCDDVFASLTYGVMGLDLLDGLHFTVIDANNTAYWMEALDALVPRRPAPTLAPSPMSDAVVADREKAEAARSTSNSSSSPPASAGVRE